MKSILTFENQVSSVTSGYSLVGHTKSNVCKTKMTSGFWNYIVIIFMAITISGCTTTTTDISELERVLKKMMVETMREKGQRLNITEFTLVHQGGNNYEGLAKGTLDGRKIELDVDVVCDGESFKADWGPTAACVQEMNNKIIEEGKKEYDKMMNEYQKEQERYLKEAEMQQKQLEMQMNTRDWDDVY